MGYYFNHVVVQCSQPGLASSKVLVEGSGFTSETQMLGAKMVV